MASGALRRRLAPPWRVLLLSDGSVTRHLQLLADCGAIAADCFQMAPIGQDVAGLPPSVALIPGPRLQRQVFLRSSSGQALVYAASWWATETAAAVLQQVQRPMWVSLSAQRTELFRDVQRLYLGYSKPLERAFGTEGPFWARLYVFYRDGKAITLIYEVFSPALDQYLGPSELDKHPSLGVPSQSS
eukprot:SM000006S19380  [mRNA]  locus=s6:419977:421148:+ [translate_table: standard]